MVGPAKVGPVKVGPAKVGLAKVGVRLDFVTFDSPHDFVSFLSKSFVPSARRSGQTLSLEVR